MYLETNVTEIGEKEYGIVEEKEGFSKLFQEYVDQMVWHLLFDELDEEAKQKFKPNPMFSWVWTFERDHLDLFIEEFQAAETEDDILTVVYEWLDVYYQNVVEYSNLCLLSNKNSKS